MQFTQFLLVAFCLYGQVFSQFVASKFYDTSSGITYASITITGVAYRVALPPLNSPNPDAIIQIVSPTKNGWCGFSWGGRMLRSPLSIAWATKQTSGQQAIIGNWMATAYARPSPYSGASHTPIAISPSKTNGTHWTATARCIGCTKWDTTDLTTKSGETRFAYACSTTAPTNPSSNTSSFSVHDSPGSWLHDLNIARNSSFSNWIA
ncbi:iron reductase domain protein [Aaosphaeria arxii CBS 175.79]|uniref:Iron reductase domain protein n=1 Tax=Aaosphaeria arxii CBS 175.79 TaxID=1450172 RepID=A0A6A5XB35_9PLEO|nr:iron reductase domain protein [Aaosphaeria arxii CBS 175.79]KAF2010188.1 iron reductase domain protein [Aaosphaeria arxii CBS 175.79]